MLKGLMTGLLLLLCIPLISGAADVDLGDVIGALETPFKAETKSSEQIKDFSANFSQESHIASIDRTQHGQGVVQFKFIAAAAQKSVLAKFRWEYHKPTVQEIISDGQTMWVYLPENRQVIESDIGRIDAQRGQNPVTFLSGLGNLSQDFFISWGSPRVVENGGYLLQLEPRQASQFIQKIEIVVNKEAINNWLKKHKTGEVFPIISTLVTDPGGNLTVIEFRDVQVNQKLADKLFSFERPAGVELVDPGEQLSF